MRNKKRFNYLIFFLFFLCILLFFFHRQRKKEYNFVSEQELFLRVDRIHEIKNTKHHIETPDIVKAFYMTSWTASSPSLRKKIVDQIDKTDINSLVLDIKDYSGQISFNIDNPLIDSFNTDSQRISDIDGFIQDLHNKNIYLIGRITVFQDPLLAKRKPEYSFKRKDNGGIWKDRKGIAFLDPQNKKVWEYILTLAIESYELGFDEINFDYIRYPSDGNINNLDYNLGGKNKIEVMDSFYTFLDGELREKKSIPISADLFGMTASRESVPGIGQKLSDALVHFDSVAPMVYPSHYSSGTYNFQNPAEHPYEIVFNEMSSAYKLAQSLGLSHSSLRTWIQDFDLRAKYDAEKIQNQIRATQDAGVPSFMVWNPKNRYSVNTYK